MKRGFTLTELLLALSIIGIVSALTMSNLFRNTFDKTNVALLQQTYTEVGDAYTQALIENGVRMVADLPMYATDVDDSVAALILQYYMNGSNCDEDSACFADKYYSDSGNSSAKTFPENISDMVRLKSGVSVAMSSTDNENPLVLIDLDGAEGENVLGRDFFTFAINEYGKPFFENYSKTKSEAKSECTNSSDTYGFACMYYLENNNWEIDY